MRPPRAHKHPDPRRPVECDLGDMIAMEAAFVRRREYPVDDYHWAKRGAVVIAGVLLFWWGLIVWVAG